MASLIIFWYGEWEVLLHYWQVGVEIQVSHSASVDTQMGEGSSLLLGRNGISSSQLVLHWYHREVALLQLLDSESSHSSLGFLWLHSSRKGDRHFFSARWGMVWVLGPCTVSYFYSIKFHAVDKGWSRKRFFSSIAQGTDMRGHRKPEGKAGELRKTSRKSLEFSYINNEQIEFERKNSVLFTLAAPPPMK